MKTGVNWGVRGVLPFMSISPLFHRAKRDVLTISSGVKKGCKPTLLLILTGVYLITPGKPHFRPYFSSFFLIFPHFSSFSVVFLSFSCWKGANYRPEREAPPYFSVSHALTPLGESPPDAFLVLR